MGFPTIATPWDESEVATAVNQVIAERRTTTRRSSMKLGPYNGFSGDLRVDVDWRLKIAMEIGAIPKPSQCSVCGTTEGRLDYHNEDYGNPYRAAAICQKCHLSLHNRHRSPGYLQSWQKKVERYGDGTKWFEELG